MQMQMKLLMKETGVEPDSISLVIILSAAASLSALTKGKEIRGFMLESGYVCSLWKSRERKHGIYLYQK